MLPDEDMPSDKLFTLGRRILLRWLPFLLWMGWIYWLSDQPSMPHPGRSVGLSDELFDYAAHAFTFGLFTILVWRVSSGGGLPTSFSRRAIHASVLLAALYGLTDEIHQSFVPGRWAKIEDWLADMAGVLLAAALLVFWQRHGECLRAWAPRAASRLGLGAGAREAPDLPE